VGVEQVSDFDKLRGELRRQGFAVERTSRGHHRVTSSDGKQTVFSDSEDHRAFKNSISDLKKIGFAWPPPEHAKSNGNGYVAPARCPSCALMTFDTGAGTCQNPECPSHAAVDTDALYLEVKTAKELAAEAHAEMKRKQLEVERATVELHAASTEYDKFRGEHERLKKQLIKALEE
jgi:hypothetical protein